MQPPPPPSIEPASPRLAADERRVRLSTIAQEVSTCVKCDLAKSRTNTVFARGNPDSELLFVGEGPGYNEDLQGSPFVGQAGQLLDKMISAMGFNVDDVYICNVVKCRPPENRNPLPPEMDACLPYLTEQLRAVSPRVIVALGRVAGQGLGCFTPESKGWRGVWRTWDSIPVMPTYHPAFLLRSPQFKRQVWEDLQKVMTRLGKG
ncbi:MAG: uracil-DNA glycosylase [Sandaracinaceae bacterium]|nr:uracil-DNA glycosylase [Sandaracinaceae bacterium]